MRLLTILLVGGGILIPLLWTVTVWRKQQRFRRLLKNERCRMCGNGFDEALHEVMGPITPEDQECNAVNLCADNGVPMKAYPA